jgi:hypothetical protein
MIVTSLPISYKVNRPHRVMVSPYTVSVIAKMTGAKAFFPLNMMSLRGEAWGSVAEGVATYERALSALGYLRTEDTVLSDASPEVVRYAQECVARSVDDGVCEFRPEDISTCTCGRVEILTRLVDVLAESNQLRVIDERNGLYYCKVCASELQEKRHETLMYQQGDLAQPMVWPSIYMRSLAGAVGELEQKTYLVSRRLSARKYETAISSDLCIDPDFHTAIYLRYLSEIVGDSEVSVVVSAQHLYRGSRAIATANGLGTPIRFNLIVHPMFDFATGNTMFGRTMSSAEYLDLLGGATALKLFQATMLQWGRAESYCNTGDLPLLKKTIPSLFQYGAVGTVSLEDVMRLLNRNRLLAVLKKVRKNHILTDQEQCLIAAVL